jgi:hypothetical protein
VARKRRQLADRRDAQPQWIVETFNEAGVEFIVIGGVAALAHGVQRITRDFDFLIEPSAANRKRAIKALVSLEAEEYLPASKKWVKLDPKASPAWLLKQPRFFDSDAGGIDICNAIDGVPEWPEALAGSIEITAFGQTFRILGKDALIKSKLAAGRPKDAGDVAELTDLDAEVS